MLEIMIDAKQERFHCHSLVTKVLHVDLALDLVHQVQSRSSDAESPHTLHSFALLQNACFCQFFIQC